MVLLKDFLVLLIVSIPWVFQPTTLQSIQPECPPNLPAVYAGHCRFGQEVALEGIPITASSKAIETEKNVYLPAIQTGPALQENSDQENSNEAADFNRVIDQPVTQEKYHIVRPAETLQKIARLHDTTVELLLLANTRIVNPNLIHVGQQLRIPSPAETKSLRKEAEQRRLENQRVLIASVPHNNERWIDVDLQSQTVRAYEGEDIVNTFIVSTGTARYPTVKGQFRIWIKLKADDMRGPGYNLKDVPYVMYFHKGYGLHGTYWHNNFGTPMSHGCVNLRTEDAAWLFDFSNVGTLVNVH